MDNRSTKIEFRTIQPFQSDIEDLSQECTAYMKTKQFMAKRIHQQQEEIEALKQSVIFYSGKDIQMHEMIRNLNEQLDLLKKEREEFTLGIKKNEKVGKTDTKEKEKSNDSPIILEDSNSDLAASFVYEDNFDLTNTVKKPENGLKNCINSAEGCESPLSIPFNSRKKNETLNKEMASEIVELRKEIEKLKIENLDKTIELNKIKTDKFIIFNELNELVNSLKRVDIDKLNSFYKKNSNSLFTKLEMPNSKGIKLNILSAQSQLNKILLSDSIKMKIQNNPEVAALQKNIDPESSSPNQLTNNLFERQQIDFYTEIIKKTEEEFDNLLDKKLSKRSKTFYYY